MDQPVYDGRAARERIAAMQAQADRMVAESRAMAERMQSVSATASDANGVAQVTVDSSGNITAIKLTERARRQAPDHTSEMIMQAIAAAKAALKEQTRIAVEETVGADSATGQAMLRGLDQRLGGA
jgi:DNA-binding protein YbaB